ncbi:hypothetical protein [Sphingomonas hylomeconis]|uniref:Uncharacterized protein n=1 Tax=Sphingomonas hylomeconis TaxID=1395958 RepID=A0ABV7SRP5_9SPHN|nr:hypothetical protein [Sphingomonas hylomeconis]
MKTLPSAAMAEIVAGTAIEVGAVEILCDPPVRVWGGPWPIEIEGEEYIGIGDRGLARVSAGALGSAAQDVTLQLSGVDPDVLPLLEAEELRAAPAVLRRLIFSGAGALLDVQVFTRGRIDQVTSQDIPGSTATITAKIEGAARGLRRRGGRMRTDADQRLVKPLDGGLRAIGYSFNKTLYWGGKPPQRAGVAAGGSLRDMLVQKIQKL